MRVYAAIAKRDDEARMVYGYASTEAMDSQGEIVTRDALRAALPDFMRFANIREMHQPSAVGRAEEAEIDARGLYLAAHIVDDAAWAKVRAGVYNGFSIAGRVTSRDPAEPHMITGCSLTEISLVDRPANPEAIFDLYKSAYKALRMFRKEGRRNSTEDQSTIQAIHDQACSLGAACGGDDFEPDNDPDPEDDNGGDMGLEKAMARRFQKLHTALDKIVVGLAAQNARLTNLEIRPSIPRGSLKAVAKADDLGDPNTGPSATNDTHALIRQALTRPFVI